MITGEAEFLLLLLFVMIFEEFVSDVGTGDVGGGAGDFDALTV